MADHGHFQSLDHEQRDEKDEVLLHTLCTRFFHMHSACLDHLKLDFERPWSEEKGLRMIDYDLSSDDRLLFSIYESIIRHKAGHVNKITDVLDVYLMPCLLFFGLLSNVILILCLLNLKRYLAIIRYLIIQAALDSAVLLMTIIPIWIFRSLRTSLFVKLKTSTSPICLLYIYTLHCFEHLDSCLMVLIAYDIYIIYTQESKIVDGYTWRKKSNRLIMIMIAFVTIIDAHIFWSCRLTLTGKSMVEGDDVTIKECGYYDQDLTRIQHIFRHAVLPITDIMVEYVAPFAATLVSLVLVIKGRQTKVSQPDSSHRRFMLNPRIANSLKRPLISLLLLNILFRIPTLACHIAEYRSRDDDQFTSGRWSVEVDAKLRLFDTAAKATICAWLAFKLAFYCAYSKYMRKEAVTVVLCQHYRRRRKKRVKKLWMLTLTNLDGGGDGEEEEAAEVTTGTVASDTMQTSMQSQVSAEMYVNVAQATAGEAGTTDVERQDATTRPCAEEVTRESEQVTDDQPADPRPYQATNGKGSDVGPVIIFSPIFSPLSDKSFLPEYRDLIEEILGKEPEPSLWGGRIIANRQGIAKSGGMRHGITDEPDVPSVEQERDRQMETIEGNNSSRSSNTSTGGPSCTVCSNVPALRRRVVSFDVEDKSIANVDDDGTDGKMEGSTDMAGDVLVNRAVESKDREKQEENTDPFAKATQTLSPWEKSVDKAPETGESDDSKNLQVHEYAAENIVRVKC